MVSTYLSRPSYINALFLLSFRFHAVNPGKYASVHVLDFIEPGMLELQAGFVGTKARETMDRRLSIKDAQTLANCATVRAISLSLSFIRPPI